MNSCNKSTNFLQVLAITESLLCAAQWPHWRRSGHQEKYHTHKTSNPIWPGCICIWTPWCAGQEVKQAAEPVAPRITLPTLLSTFPWRHWCSSSAKCIRSPSKSNGGNPKPADECAPSLASEGPGEKVLCSPLPPHSPDVPASPA